VSITASDVILLAHAGLGGLGCLAALFLLIATREKLYANAIARRMVLSVTALIAITGLMVEGAGAAIDQGAKLAVFRRGAQGVQK